MATSPAFELNQSMLAADRRFARIAEALNELSPIDSEESFNRYCREACRLWSGHFRNPVGQTSEQFTNLLPQVEKWLVIREGGYLALEKHEQNDERLEVKEGAGIILWRRTADQPLAIKALAAGDEFHLEPDKEHCLIGTENLLVFERSLDPKEMDQDVIFIYEPDRGA